jgi:hypothetical protein
MSGSSSSLLDEDIERTTIWLDSLGRAPSDKFLGVDYDPNDEDGRSLSAALAILSEFAPSHVIPGTCRTGSSGFRECAGMALAKSMAFNGSKDSRYPLVTAK